VRASTRHQLDELLGNSGFLKTVDLITKEVYHVWNVSDRDAYRVVLSAIGEPATLACVHAALSPKQNIALARVIIRRRVIDLLRKDARPNNHCSLSPSAADGAEPQCRSGTFDEPLESTPRMQLEVRQVVQLVRTALDGFAAQGDKQQQQAQLLQRYVLDEVGYADLSVELTCSKTALRVRVHKAIVALRKYVQTCHPELEQLLEGRAPKHAGGHDAGDGPALADEAADRPGPRAPRSGLDGADDARACSAEAARSFLLDANELRAADRERGVWAHGSQHAITLPATVRDGMETPVIADGIQAVTTVAADRPRCRAAAQS
jgi:DNA-directed RNA polymerase specialized sigma24 family protein